MKSGKPSQLKTDIGSQMKLRIKGDSLRLRISPSEMSRLLLSGRVEETVRFGPGRRARLTYALSTNSGGLPPGAAISVQYQAHEMLVMVDATQAKAWADGTGVGLYANINTGGGQLEVAVEKDFACLDKSEPENHDTFPHPHQGSVC
jgi:hypothetical protein